jgi:hypothetical protein
MSEGDRAGWWAMAYLYIALFAKLGKSTYEQ